MAGPRWNADYDGDLRSFSLLNLVRDALGLVSAFGLRSVAAVVGHDFGALVAAWCALVRPDVFRALTLMSAPFAGRRPSLRYGRRAGGCESARSRSCEPRRTAASAKTLPMVLFDPRGERRHVELPAGRARVHARLLPSQERRLARQQAVSAGRVDGGRTGEAADLLRHGARQGDGGNGRRAHADGGADRRLQMAHRAASLRSMPPNTRATAFRAGCSGIAAAPVAASSPSLRCFPPHHRRAVGLHLRRERLGHSPAAGRAGGDAAPRLHADDRLSSDRRCRPLGAAGAT